MKKTIIHHFLSLIILLVGSFFLYGCDEDEDIPDMVSPVASGSFIDERDGETYHWVQYGNLQWMTENFRYDINSDTDCRNYIDHEDWVDYAAQQPSTRNRAKYGMYYTLQGAHKACPDGWRLPSDDDWKQLEMALGMSASDVEKYDWRGNVSHNMVTTKDNETFLKILLGGYVTLHVYTFLRNGSRYKGAWGFYWTDSKDSRKDGDFYIYRKFAYNQNKVCRESMEKVSQMLSVRFVRDANLPQ